MVLLIWQCGSAKCVKDGIVKGKQRHRYKSCNFRHTVQHRGRSPEVKRQALVLYLQGLGFRSVGRFLQCSHVAVYNRCYRQTLQLKNKLG